MKVRVLEEKGRKLRFELEGVSTAFANALRRTMISSVPTYAIENVIFIENDSVLYDEIIAHRLGLVPLKTDLPSDLLLNTKYPPVKFTIQKKGPCTVYSKDLNGTDKVVKPVYDNIPITKLGDGQRLVLEAEAVLGIGKDHAKWQPTTLCVYKEKGKSFEFTVESSGVLDPKEIVTAATRIIEGKVAEFKKELKSL